METHERGEILREGEETQMEMGDLEEMETLQIGEEEDLLEKMEIQEEEMVALAQMMMGIEMNLHPHQTLHCLEEGT